MSSHTIYLTGYPQTPYREFWFDLTDASELTPLKQLDFASIDGVTRVSHRDFAVGVYIKHNTNWAAVTPQIVDLIRDTLGWDEYILTGREFWSPEQIEALESREELVEEDEEEEEDEED